MSEKSPSELINDFFVDLKNSQDLTSRQVLSGNFYGTGQFSPIGQEFINDDEFLFDKVLPNIAKLLVENEFSKEIVEFQKMQIAVEIERHYANLKNKDIGQEREIILIETKEKYFKNISVEKLKESASSIFHEVIIAIIKNPSKNQTENNYFYAYLLNIAYDKFLQRLALEKKYNRTDPEKNLISQYYKNIDIDLGKTDKQFRKYDLYSVGADSEIFVALPSRIIDKKNNLQFIVEMNEALLQMLVDCKKNGHLVDLAMLARSQSPIESEQRISILLGTHKNPAALKIQDIYSENFPYVVQDAIECRFVSDDKLFSSDVIYKFHEIGCGDAIWVFSKGNSVEFEEILENPEILDDYVVTQMIHLEYVVNGGRIKISHIDHEYLFYTYEEFDKRLEDYNQKAGAKKRIKTFKVDRSKIPLVFEDGTFFLYTVLNAYFAKAYFLQKFLVYGCGLKDVAEMVKKI